jgi:hypothetical protein
MKRFIPKIKQGVCGMSVIKTVCGMDAAVELTGMY